MNIKTIIIGVVALLLGAVGGVLGTAHSVSFGSFNAIRTETNPVWYYNGFKAGTASSFVVNKSGCIQTYATSTATAIKLVPSAKGATSTYAGTIYWSYGTCSN